MPGLLSYVTVELCENVRLPSRVQGWASGSQYARGIAMANDGSVLLGGFTFGPWEEGSSSRSTYDFAAVKVDTDGVEDWRWQVSGPETGIEWK